MFSLDKPDRALRMFRLYSIIDKDIKEIFNKYELDDEEVILILSVLANEYMEKLGINYGKEKSK